MKFKNFVNDRCKVKQQTLTTLPPGRKIFKKLPKFYSPIFLKKLPKFYLLDFNHDTN
jgi:hypothetical protein